MTFQVGEGQLTDDWFAAQAAKIAAEHKAYEASLRLDAPDIWKLSEPVEDQNHDWINRSGPKNTGFYSG